MYFLSNVIKKLWQVNKFKCSNRFQNGGPKSTTGWVIMLCAYCGKTDQPNKEVEDFTRNNYAILSVSKRF